MPKSDELIETLAAYAHAAWSRRMRYLFEASATSSDGYVTIPKTLADRWKRQMETEYADLPETEKKSDIIEATRIVRIFCEAGLLE